MRSLLLLTIILPLCYTFPQGQGFSNQLRVQKCTSFASSDYNCVPYFLCDDNGYIITDGGDIFDIRSSAQIQGVEIVVDHKDATESSCDKLIHVCCRHPRAKENTITIPNPKPVGTDRTDRALPQCGKRNENGVGITKGALLEDGEAQFGEWPHVCAVLKEEDLGGGNKVNIYQCAGSLISEEAILTAAHCIKDAKEAGAKLLVRCGEWDTLSESESLEHQERIVKQTFIHPNFNPKNLHNNFALLVTENNFILADHISPVCLPKPGDFSKATDCVSNGWGKDKFGSEGQYQTRLKEIQLPLVKNKECQNRLRDTRLGNFFQLDDSFMCAGGEGADTCKGDGGGPLTCRYDGSSTYTQVGIVSWGIGCGDGIPAVYADVSKAACWIDKTLSCFLEKLKIDTFSNKVPSYFGFDRDDCPGEFAPGKCPEQIGDRNNNNPNYEDYEYPDETISDIFDTL